MKKSTAVLLGVGVLAAAGAAYLIMSRPHAAQAASAPAPAPSPPQCSCPAGWNPSIIVINSQRQMIPGAQVYIDGQYAGTTGSDITNMGMISSELFTPCVQHEVKAVACDGTSATVGLGYWCYPGNIILNDVIMIRTPNCGGSIGWSGPVSV
ncbi:MAG: hypothetical protein RXP77_05140 [Nitrososphaeria archaeon]